MIEDREASPLPERITIRVLSSGVPLAGALVGATFETFYKNDHDVLMGPTDAGGRAYIERAQVIEDTEQTCRYFLMDYGSLEGCFAGTIRFRWSSSEDIERAIEARSIYSNYEYPRGYGDMLAEAKLVAEAQKPETITIDVEVEPAGMRLVVQLSEPTQ